MSVPKEGHDAEELEAKRMGYSRRRVVAAGVGAVGMAALRPVALLAQTTAKQAGAVTSSGVKVFDVTAYGAAGDGVTLDSPAFQRAIDAAAAGQGKARVLVPAGKTYLIGTVNLKGPIDFHLEGDARLLVSLRKEDYAEGDGSGPGGGAVIMATGVKGLTISGTGSVMGRAREFMASYDEVGGIWKPKDFRPKMFILTECRDLVVRDITFGDSPNWGLHMLGCDGVLVDNVKVRNRLDVPNCDGIDPDHSRNVEIRNCDIVCGDDGIVAKCSRQAKDYGPCANIHVHDCTIETQDAGVKIGTETTADVHDVVFERCTIKTASRGLCIQLRDEGSVYNVAFRDITFTSRYYGDPWWGRGEAISFTALPRTATTKTGSLHHITVTNVTGHAENSVRVRGSEGSRVHDITFDKVAVTFEKKSAFKGGLYDNRPGTVAEPIEMHDTPGFSIEHADRVTLKDCTVAWGETRPDFYSYALEAKDTTGLVMTRFQGEAAHPVPGGKAVSIV